MKKILILPLLIAAITVYTAGPAKAQSVADLVQELTLDYQKLAGMKSTLNHMYSGYNVLTRGYNAVKGVSMDNFNQHKTFLDAQLLVSPGVRAYPRARDILRNQQDVISEYRSAKSSYAGSDLLTPEERNFLSAVYERLTQASADDLDELNRVTTDSQLRMTDAERLAAIDRLYLQSTDQLGYLRKFNEQLAGMIRQRQAYRNDRQNVNSLYR
jgi:hypothetical protein